MQPYRHVGARTQAPQASGKPFRPLVQLPITERLVVEYDGDRIGRKIDLLFTGKDGEDSDAGESSQKSLFQATRIV